MSEDPKLIIEYANPADPPRQLTLEDEPQFVRVTFGVSPLWVPVVGITLTFLMAAMQTALPIRIWWRMKTLWATLPATLPIQRELPTWRTPAVQIALMALPWWIAAIYHLFMLRKWGRVPKILDVTSEKITLSSLGFWRMKHRTQPVSELAGIDFHLLKSILPWLFSAELTIRFAHARSIKVRLTSKDSALPLRIHQAILRITTPSTAKQLEDGRSTSAIG